jgi:hypothetical protein
MYFAMVCNELRLKKSPLEGGISNAFSVLIGGMLLEVKKPDIIPGFIVFT